MRAVRHSRQLGDTLADAEGLATRHPKAVLSKVGEGSKQLRVGLIRGREVTTRQLAQNDRAIWPELLNSTADNGHCRLLGSEQPLGTKHGPKLFVRPNISQPDGRHWCALKLNAHCAPRDVRDIHKSSWARPSWEVLRGWWLMKVNQVSYLIVGRPDCRQCSCPKCSAYANLGSALDHLLYVYLADAM